MRPAILKLGDLLIVTLQSALSDREFDELRRDLVDRTAKDRARAVIVDVSSLDVLDSFASRTLRMTAEMVRLRGARTVVVGLQPEVAFTMVQLGLGFEKVETALDLEDGMRLLGRKV